MSTRRKPKPLKFRDGGAVPMADVRIPGDDAPPEIERAAAPAPLPPAPEPGGDDALVQAAEATRRAEELQRAMRATPPPAQPQPQPQSAEDVIAAMQVPDAAKDWLRQRPEYITDPALNQRIGAVHNFLVGVKNIEPFSSTYFAALDQLHDEVAQRRELSSAAARPTPENFEITQRANELEQEAQAARAELQPPPPPPPPPQPHRSMPISAPVSRDTPMPSGHREAPGRVTLSAEEMQIAEISFPHLSRIEAAKAYYANKQKMERMKAEGYWDGK